MKSSKTGKTPKTCSRCKRALLLRDFHQNCRRCKECNNAVQAERRAADLAADPEIPKRCFRCKQTKPVREFHPGSWCKQCYTEYSHEDRCKRPKRYLIIGAKYRARRDGLPINITEEDIVLPDVCPDTGIPLVTAKGKVRPNSPSLDRIIPELGYVKGNVRVVSNFSNRMKQETSLLYSARIWANVLEQVPEGYVLDGETRAALQRLAQVIRARCP